MLVALAGSGSDHAGRVPEQLRKMRSEGTYCGDTESMYHSQ